MSKRGSKKSRNQRLFQRDIKAELRDPAGRVSNILNIVSFVTKNWYRPLAFAFNAGIGRSAIELDLVTLNEVPMDQLPNSEKPPASSVWPPPATGVPTIRLRPGFISLRNMVLPIGILVSLGVLLELVTTILGLVPQTGQVEAVNSLAGSVSSIVYLLQSILYFIWLYRAYGNLNAFFTAGQSFTPGWAVGWYFVPIFNLFRPYSAMVELWRASSPAVDSSVEAEWRSLPNPKIVNTWWIVFILDNVVWLLLIPTFFLHATHPAYSDFAAIVNGVTGSAELILEFRVVRGLTDLQEQKEQAMISADRGEGA